MPEVCKLKDTLGPLVPNHGTTCTPPCHQVSTTLARSLSQTKLRTGIKTTWARGIHWTQSQVHTNLQQSSDIYIVKCFLTQPYTSMYIQLNLQVNRSLKKNSHGQFFWKACGPARIQNSQPFAQLQFRKSIYNPKTTFERHAWGPHESHE